MQHNPQRLELIEAIHESDLRLALAVTGGGSGLISELLAVPGASRTVLDASVPYSQAALTRFLGRAPDSFCAADTSRMMAVRAYFNALPLHGEQVTAIGSTAALASRAPKRGDHRLFKSIQTRHRTTLVEVVLEKNRRSRIEEEQLVVELGLAELGNLIGFDYEPYGLNPADQLRRFTVDAQPEWTEVFLGKRDYCLASRSDAEPPRGVGILAGSFNPLHSGHAEMAEMLQARLGVAVHFELAIRNADKPPIDYLTIRQRLEQFDDQPVWLTNSATFVEKSRVFPGNLFIVGMDTIARIGDPRYYPEPGGLRRAIDELRDNQTRFVVFGRHDGSRFVTLEDLPLLPELKALCEEIPESEFRNDVSSTLLRGANNTLAE